MTGQSPLEREAALRRALTRGPKHAPIGDAHFRTDERIAAAARIAEAAHHHNIEEPSCP